MALKDIFRVNRKTFFDPARWVGISQIKSVTSSIVSITSDLFTLPDSPKKETFSQAVKRLKLADADIEKSKKLFWTYSIIFSIFGLMVLCYGCYLGIVHKTIAGFFLALSVASLLFAYAFKFNFNYFQIKHAHLGCTIKEWRQGKIDPSRDKK